MAARAGMSRPGLRLLCALTSLIVAALAVSANAHAAQHRRHGHAAPRSNSGPPPSRPSPTSDLFQFAGVEGGVFKPPLGVARRGQRYRYRNRRGFVKPKTLVRAADAASPQPAIPLSTPADVTTMRNNLIQYIWKGSGFPTATPGLVQVNVGDDPWYHTLTGLYRMDKLTVSLDYGMTSSMYVFWPSVNNNRLMVVTNGHDGSPSVMMPTVQYFLSKGYVVLEAWMPLIPPFPAQARYPTVSIPDYGSITLWSHDYFRWLDTSTFSPIKLFVEPVAEGLNYMLTNYWFSQVSMVGFAGGAWTTTLYAALDRRVQKSYPVAGTLPIYLRNQYAPGDWEQIVAGLYHTAEYMSQYVLGSYGTTPTGLTRNQLQILNSNDPCCFSGAQYNTYPYQSAIDSKLAELGGSASQFGVTIVANNSHTMSATALAAISADQGP
jgi:hypothetical protein